MYEKNVYLFLINKIKEIMKNLFLTFVILFISTIIFAQGLNQNANYIKKNYSIGYKQTLKKHALQKWDDDYEMVVHMINNQADALINLINEFKSDNTNIAFKSILKWSIDGYKSLNMKRFEKINTFGLKQLIFFHCDWEMVKYEYDNQVKAKNSF